MSDQSFVVISNEECFNAFRRLLLGHKKGRPSDKNNNQDYDEISLILNEFGLEITKQPNDEEPFKLWNLEFKRLQRSLAKMKLAIKHKKFSGNFFDSRKYSALVSRSTKDLEEEPEVRKDIHFCDLYLCFCASGCF